MTTPCLPAPKRPVLRCPSAAPPPPWRAQICPLLRVPPITPSRPPPDPLQTPSYSWDVRTCGERGGRDECRHGIPAGLAPHPLQTLHTLSRPPPRDPCRFGSTPPPHPLQTLSRPPPRDPCRFGSTPPPDPLHTLSRPPPRDPCRFGAFQRSPPGELVKVANHRDMHHM
eukprot:967479-Prorocentrum_minimum.AAC.3